MPNPLPCSQQPPALLFSAAVAEGGRSASTGVEGVVVVDYRRGITEGVLKQQCEATRMLYEDYQPLHCDRDRDVCDDGRGHISIIGSVVGAGEHL